MANNNLNVSLVKSYKVKTLFLDRLISALTFQGITERKAQIAKLAEIAHITITTAAKYLQAENPQFSRKRPHIFNDLVIGLDCDWRWLYDGMGYDPWELAVARNMATMTDWQINKMVRMCIRLKNGDGKALNNLTLFNCGFINHDQLLSVM